MQLLLARSHERNLTVVQVDVSTEVTDEIRNSSFETDLTRARIRPQRGLWQTRLAGASQRIPAAPHPDEHLAASGRRAAGGVRGHALQDRSERALSLRRVAGKRAVEQLAAGELSSALVRQPSSGIKEGSPRRRSRHADRVGPARRTRSAQP